MRSPLIAMRGSIGIQALPNRVHESGAYWQRRPARVAGACASLVVVASAVPSLHHLSSNVSSTDRISPVPNHVRPSSACEQTAVP